MRTDAIGYHHKHDHTFRFSRPEGAGDWLLLVIKTPALFRIDGEEIHVDANSVIIYTLGYPQHYRADGGEYIDDWLHFEPDESDRVLIDQLGIPLNTPVHIGNAAAVSAIIKNMCFEHYSAHPNRSHIVNLYFQMLLYKLNEQMTHPYSDVMLRETVYTDQLLWIRQSIFRWPEQDWNADLFAKELTLSHSRFHHLYTSTFGTTMMQDIISSRIQRACKLLKDTQLPVEDIAEQCGYVSVSHFIRLFKKVTGVTPRRYRQNQECDVILSPSINHDEK